MRSSRSPSRTEVDLDVHDPHRATTNERAVTTDGPDAKRRRRSLERRLDLWLARVERSLVKLADETRTDG